MCCLTSGTKGGVGERSGHPVVRVISHGVPVSVPEFSPVGCRRGLVRISYLSTLGIPPRLLQSSPFLRTLIKNLNL